MRLDLLWAYQGPSTGPALVEIVLDWVVIAPPRLYVQYTGRFSHVGEFFSSCQTLQKYRSVSVATWRRRNVSHTRNTESNTEHQSNGPSLSRQFEKRKKSSTASRSRSSPNPGNELRRRAESKKSQPLRHHRLRRSREAEKPLKQRRIRDLNQRPPLSPALHAMTTRN